MDFKRIKLEFLEWLRKAGAGFMISGSSGTGKSQLIRLIIHSIVAGLDGGIWLLDPSGDLVAEIERDLATMPPSVRDRVVILKPFDVRNKIAGPNSLSVKNPGDPIRWRAKIATKAKHVAMILLTAWGETDFSGKPLLFKWVTRFLWLLALASLPVAAIRYFFDPSHPVYKALTRIAPDFITQMELEDLADLSPRQREEIIASTKNRFLGLLSNPIIELLFSITDNAVDVQQLIQEGKIVLISFETGEGVLDDCDVEILANVYLMEIVFAIFNTPRAQRKWTTVCVDELPLFRSSFALLRKVMPLTRKLLMRWIVSFQGAFVFPQGVDDPLLNLAIGQCGVHFVFGHGNHKDCDFFARQVAYSHYDPNRRKHTQVVPTQIQVGREILELYDEAVNWTESEQRGGSDAEASTATTTKTQQTGAGAQTSEQVQMSAAGTALGRAVTTARSERDGHSQADASGSTTTSSVNWGKTISRGGSRSKKQTVVPILKTIEVEQITWLTADEQFMESATQIAGFSTGECIVHRRGIETAAVRLPMVQSLAELTPTYTQKKVTELETMVGNLPFYHDVQQLISHNEHFTCQLVAQLEAAPIGNSSQEAAALQNFETQNHPLLGI